MYLVYIVILITILNCSKASIKTGWCERYSKNSSFFKEDLSVIEHSERQFPKCQWQVRLQGVTKLVLQLQISQMPFSSTFDYDQFRGQVAKTKYDTIQILGGDCCNGKLLLTISGTTQITTKLVKTNTVCFKYVSNSETYYENRLQLRVMLIATEVICRSGQRPKNINDGCKTVCLPNNTTKTVCPTNYPNTTYSTMSTLSRHPQERTSSQGLNRTTAKSTKTLAPNSLLFTVQPRKTGYTSDKYSHSFYTTNRPLTRNMLRSSTRYISITNTTLFENKSNLVTRTSKTLPTTDKASTKQHQPQMRDEDIREGLYIASTIAGILTVTVIVLIICCARKTREIKRLTTIMFHMSSSRDKQEHRRVHRQDINSLSSTTSSLRPALPPRPIDLPSVKDATTEIDISHYHHSEIYDNIGSIKRFQNKVDHKNYYGDSVHGDSISDTSSNKHENLKSHLNNERKCYTNNCKERDIKDEGFLSLRLKRSISDQSIGSSNTIGQYIDNSSITSNMYRKVLKHRHY